MGIRTRNATRTKRWEAGEEWTDCTSWRTLRKISRMLAMIINSMTHPKPSISCIPKKKKQIKNSICFPKHSKTSVKSRKRSTAASPRPSRTAMLSSTSRDSLSTSHLPSPMLHPEIHRPNNPKKTHGTLRTSSVPSFSNRPQSSIKTTSSLTHLSAKIHSSKTRK